MWWGAHDRIARDTVLSMSKRLFRECASSSALPSIINIMNNNASVRRTGFGGGGTRDSSYTAPRGCAHGFVLYCADEGHGECQCRCGRGGSVTVVCVRVVSRWLSKSDFLIFVELPIRTGLSKRATCCDSIVL